LLYFWIFLDHHEYNLDVNFNRKTRFSARKCMPEQNCRTPKSSTWTWYTVIIPDFLSLESYIMIIGQNEPFDFYIFLLSFMYPWNVVFFLSCLVDFYDLACLLFFVVVLNVLNLLNETVFKSNVAGHLGFTCFILHLFPLGWVPRHTIHWFVVILLAVRCVCLLPNLFGQIKQKITLSIPTNINKIKSESPQNTNWHRKFALDLEKFVKLTKVQNPLDDIPFLLAIVRRVS